MKESRFTARLVAAALGVVLIASFSQAYGLLFGFGIAVALTIPIVLPHVGSIALALTPFLLGVWMGPGWVLASATACLAIPPPPPA